MVSGRLFQLILVVLFGTLHNIWAQVPATLYSTKGEILTGFIDEPNPNQGLKQIVFYSNIEKENPQKFYPRTLQYVKYVPQSQSDFLTIRSLRIDDSFKFGWIAEDGFLQLIEVVEKEKIKGKSELKTRYYLLDSAATELPEEISASNFRRVSGRKIKAYVRLYKDLNAKVYEFEHREQLVAEYNRWIRAGKPASSWTEENGNYTLKTDPGLQIKAQKPEPTNTYSPLKINLETGAYLGLGLIQYDEFTFNQLGLRFSNPGPGYQIQMGANLELQERILIRSGLNLSAKGLRVNYTGEIEIDSTSVLPIQLTETWNMTYLGGYLLVEYHQNDFFFGGGLDFSFHPFLKQRITGENEQIKIDEEGSLLFESPLNQFDIVLSTGFTMKDPHGKFRIKPLLTYHLPVQNLLRFYDPIGPITGLNQYPLAGISFRLGVVVDFVIK